MCCATESVEPPGPFRSFQGQVPPGQTQSPLRFSAEPRPAPWFSAMLSPNHHSGRLKADRPRCQLSPGQRKNRSKAKDLCLRMP